MITFSSRATCRRLVAACIVAVVAAGGAGAQPPVAPAPEAVFEAAGVVPVAHVESASASPPSGAARLGPVPLAPAGEPAAGGGRGTSGRDLGNWTILAALAAAFAILAAVRFRTHRRPAPLPADVFELLGEAPLGGQHSVRVVRFGPRTLLVGVSSAGCRTLAEIDDAQATDCIVAACRGLPTRGRPTVAAAGLARAVGRPAAGVNA